MFIFLYAHMQCIPSALERTQSGIIFLIFIILWYYRFVANCSKNPYPDISILQKEDLGKSPRYGVCQEPFLICSTPEPRLSGRQSLASPLQTNCASFQGSDISLNHPEKHDFFFMFSQFHILVQSNQQCMHLSIYL